HFDIVLAGVWVQYNNRHGTESFSKMCKNYNKKDMYKRRTTMKSITTIITIAILLSIIGMFNTAFAGDIDRVEGHVITVEPSYLPGNVTFMLDVKAGNVEIGQWLWFGGTAEQTKGVLATLLTAFTTGKKVRVYGNGATIANIHLTNKD
ncbi:MAG: hypothetical protein JW717_11600, partial [Marinilabiliaceae bacterium]|nr:hypothetical protein [Marinilabiliaceae bacterium]